MDSSSISTYRQQLVHAPRYSMLRKWDKLIDVSYKAFLKADPSDMTPQRVVEFTDKLIATMQRDQAYNYTVTTNQHNGETFLYQDDANSSLDIVRGIRDKLLNWGGYESYTATTQYGDITTRNCNNVISSMTRKREAVFGESLPKQMHDNISEICSLLMANTTYGSEFENIVKLQTKVFSILSSSAPIPQETWATLTRSERIEHLNKLALATDHIVRKILPYKLPDINKSTHDGRIVLQEPITDCITINEGEEYITRARYTHGNVLLGIDEKTAFDTTLEKDTCEDSIAHEMSHRLSDMLCNTERFQNEDILKTYNYTIESLASDIALKEKHGAGRWSKHALYLANVEETCARQQQATSAATRLLITGLGLTEDCVATAEQMNTILQEAPEEFHSFVPGLQKMLSQVANATTAQKTGLHAA